MDPRTVIGPGRGEVPLDTLAGTSKSLATAALRAGYEVEAKRFSGQRVPRQPQQERVHVTTTVLVGVAGEWGFFAAHNPRDGWDVVLYRPGWPRTMSSVTALRATFKAQTPAVLR